MEFGWRWMTLSLRKRMSPNVSSSLIRWVDWVRSGLTVNNRRDEVWPVSLRQTFFVMPMGTQIPVITEKPLVVCSCRKFQLDTLGDHLCTCTGHSGAKKVHDGLLTKLLNFSVQHTKRKHNTWLKAVGVIVERLIWLSVFRTRRVRCPWCWISVSTTTVSEVTLNLILMDTYITLMI
jgi:hypothetical protein